MRRMPFTLSVGFHAGCDFRYSSVSDGAVVVLSIVSVLVVVSVVSSDVGVWPDPTI
jgi:hypothetical protein